jgi:putative nucleotidyltransferase with HDIG domain
MCFKQIFKKVIFKIQPAEKEIFQIIRQTASELGFPTYIVGGYVRDRLLARPSKDVDIVCIGSGTALAQAVADKLSPKPKVAIFQRFGTAAFRHKSLEVEFVGARKESYRHDSRKPTVEEGTLEDDQNRRDFTINALAVSLNEADFGTILDSFGGIADLERKILRTPLEPGKTFSDDPLRMLRGIRFANQLGFTLEKETLDAIPLFKDRLKIVSNERIIVEFEKILATDKPSIGLKLLFETGLMQLIFPEMAALAGAEYQEGMGHKDNFYHTIQVVDNAAQRSKNIWLRWAAVMHDIGKPATKRFEKGEGWTFHGHQELGAAMIPRLFNNLSLPTDHRMKYVQKLVKLHHRPVSLTKEIISDSAIRRLLFDAGDDLEDLMLLCESDITSKSADRVRRYMKNYETLIVRLKVVEEKDKIRNWQPPVSGELIMETFGMAPCREVGTIKNAIREAILDGVIPNEYEPAYQFMLQQGLSLGLKFKT